MIYADHAATTPPLPEVIEAMARASRDAWGNASSVHAVGRRAHRAIEEARHAVAAALGATEASEIVFGSGGTEAVTTAIASVVPDPARAHVVTTAVEHPSVRRAVDALAARGASVAVVGVDFLGRLDPEAIVAALRPETRLVTMQWANHEIGNLYPVEAVGRACRARGVLLHVDAVQAFGKVPVRAGLADLTSICGHKAYGPQGAGALHVAHGVLLAPLFPGGQERGRRGGTEPFAALVGFGVAAERARAEGDDWSSRIASLGTQLESGLCEAGGLVNGDPALRVPGLVNVSFPGVAADLLVVALDLAGVAISAGAACSSGLPGRSPVLSALHPGDPERAGSGVRFSLGKDNDAGQVQRILEVTRQAVARLRAAPSGSSATAK